MTPYANSSDPLQEKSLLGPWEMKGEIIKSFLLARKF